MIWKREWRSQKGEWGKGYFETVRLCHFTKDLLFIFKKHERETQLEVTPDYTQSKTSGNQGKRKGNS